MMESKKSLLKFVASFVFALNAQNGHAEQKEMLDGRLVVKHAKIISSFNPTSPSAAYLIIWNGSYEYQYLSGIKGPNSIPLQLHKTQIIDGVATMRKASFPHEVPPKSELVMTKGGFHIMISSDIMTKAVDGKLTVTIEFSNGNQIEIEADIEPFGIRPTEHQHGFGDQTQRAK